MFDVFTFPLAKGDTKTALTDPYSIILTEEASEKYFGSTDPIGKILSLKVTYLEKEIDFKVTGVFEDIPGNSHIAFKSIASYSSLHTIRDEDFFTSNWDSPTWTYLLLQKNHSYKEFELLLPEFAEKNIDLGPALSQNLYLQPLEEIYFNSLGMGAPIGKAGMKFIDYILICIASIILVIACINFMNLSTAKSVCRIKEIGMRKMLGAYKRQLVSQFLGESLVYSFISLFFAVLLVELFLPKYNQFIVFSEFFGTELDINYLNNYFYLAAMLLTAVSVGIISGFYPAFFLSRFRPISVLKSTSDSGVSPKFMRKLLVIGQYTASIILIICSLMIYKQVDYWKNAEMGFKKDHIITIPILDRTVNSKYDQLKNQFLQNPNIYNITASSTEPGVTGQNGIYMKGRDLEDINMGIIYIDPDYIKTLEIEIANGRDFSAESEADKKEALFMNQRALKKLGWQFSDGDEIELYWVYGGRKEVFYQTKLIGIAEDFIFRGPMAPVQPVLLKIEPDRYKYILIIINGENVSAAIDHLRNSWSKFNFDQPFEFTFLSEDIENTYIMFDNFSILARYATIFAIFIASLGLFGLASFTIERKTKEIGVRIVLDASISKIVMYFSKSILKLVIISTILACPAAYFLLELFFQGIANRVSIDLWTFLLAGVFTMTLAFLIVSYQALRAARNNPVDSLRYE